MIPPTQLSFETIPEDQANSKVVQSKVWQEMVEVCGRVCQLLGLPRSTGQIYGLSYLSVEPLSLNQMSSMLGISKGSASMGTRQLVGWGALRKVWKPGDRKDYYEVVEDLGVLIRAGYNNLIKPKLKSSKDRLCKIEDSLSQDFEIGEISQGKKEILDRRIKAVVKIHSRINRLISLTEKIIN